MSGYLIAVFVLVGFMAAVVLAGWAFSRGHEEKRRLRGGSDEADALSYLAVNRADGDDLDHPHH
jgi:hypothetical protein